MRSPGDLGFGGSAAVSGLWFSMIARMLWNLLVCVSAVPVNPVFDTVMPSNSISTGALVFSILMVLILRA